VVKRLPTGLASDYAPRSRPLPSRKQASYAEALRGAQAAVFLTSWQGQSEARADARAVRLS
jgi:hypothetical protein